ncbi:Cof-type HAD-IIB family hydrolase [Synergistes jonesii]|uniref:Cof-type HAD-IIB family hydrolase n=1 Tax=Synergistes jonesii TaxID=2754 RepID=UPI00242E57C1|nr:Cof-type HAD-IIB family hydrolase [Synergistes jonesii]
MGFFPKMIALDIDGTLLDDRGLLSARSKRALALTIERGVKVVVATGRMFASARHVISEIGTTSPCVFCGGAAVVDPLTAETLFLREIDAELVSEIVAFYHKNGWRVQICEADALWIPFEGDAGHSVYDSAARINRFSFEDDISALEMRAVKLLGYSAEPDGYRSMFFKTRERFRDRLRLGRSRGKFIEITHPMVNKAHGADVVARFLGVEGKDVLAFGDASNDSQLLRWAGRGVAVSNSCAAAKVAADEYAPRITKTGSPKRWRSTCYSGGK